MTYLEINATNIDLTDFKVCHPTKKLKNPGSDIYLIATNT